MANRRYTIKEIAKLAGVSPTAVSFAINGREGISDATKEKILSIIKETDFYPNAASQRLIFHKSFNVAFIYPASASPFTDLFYYEVANGLTETLTRQKYNVVFTPLTATAEGYEIPHIIKRQDADGAIFLQDMSPSLLAELDDQEIPYVLVDWQSNDKTHTCISLNCEQSIFSAVQYLIENGHRRIGFFGSDQLPYYYLRCFTGYQNALAQCQLPIYPGWVQSGVHDVESAVSCLKQIAALPHKPTAICCMSDMCAIRSIQAAARLGMSLPEEMSFISIDDILLSRYIQPPLTTISYQKNEIGKVAAQLLLKKMEGKAAESVLISSDSIVERQSVYKIALP